MIIQYICISVVKIIIKYFLSNFRLDFLINNIICYILITSLLVLFLIYLYRRSGGFGGKLRAPSQRVFHIVCSPIQHSAVQKFPQCPTADLESHQSHSKFVHFSSLCFNMVETGKDRNGSDGPDGTCTLLPVCNIFKFQIKLFPIVIGFVLYRSSFSLRLLN